MNKDDKLLAVMWLFLASKGITQEFTQFYRENQGKSLARIDRETKYKLLTRG